MFINTFLSNLYANPLWYNGIQVQDLHTQVCSGVGEEFMWTKIDKEMFANLQRTIKKIGFKYFSAIHFFFNKKKPLKIICILPSIFQGKSSLFNVIEYKNIYLYI